jgi:hypothetical protein
MTPRIRKTALTAHVALSVGWLGAVASFEALAIAGLVSSDAPRTGAVYLAMETIAWFVIIPFAFGSLLSGLLMALGTKWGLFRHYWVAAKFLINSLAIILLLLHTRMIGLVAAAAADATLPSTDLYAVRIKLVAIAGAAVLALLVATTLAVFKPRGMTPFGSRRDRPLREAVSRRAHAERSRLAVRIFFAVLGAIILVLFVLHLAGSGAGHHHH